MTRPAIRSILVAGDGIVGLSAALNLVLQIAFDCVR